MKKNESVKGKMKKYILIITLVMIMCLTGCNSSTRSETYQIPEQPHLYWKDVNVVITEIDKRHWFAGTHWYVVELTVKNEEYNLEETFEIEGSGVFGCPGAWNYEEGDVVEAELYSWVMDSTGEVVNRKINRVY